MKKAILTGLVACTLAASHGLAVDIRVPADQPSVAAALGAAGVGDVIKVASTHSETTPVSIGIDVSIISHDATYTTPTPGATMGPITFGGGAIVIEGMTVDGAGAFQPAMYLPGPATDLTITGCTVTNAADWGMLVEAPASGSSLDITDSSFSNNGISGIELRSDCTGITLLADGIEVNNNAANGVFISFGTPGVLNNHVLEFRDSDFSGNGAVSDGFGLAIGQKPLTGAPVVVDNCTFSNNALPALAISWEADNPVEPSVFNVSNCTMDANFRGIEMFFLENSTVNITSTTITNSVQFGIIGDFLTEAYLTPTQVNIVDSTVAQNTFDSVFAFQGNWHAENSRFDNNTGFGFAIPGNVFTGRTISAVGCTFNGNGFSGFRCEGPQVITMTDCEISNNTFHGFECGLAAQAPPGVFDLTMEGVQIIDNPGLGFWTFAMNQDLKLREVTISGSNVTPMAVEEVQGVLATDPAFNVSVTMENCAIGGALEQAAHITGDSLVATNCIFDEGPNPTVPGTAPDLETAVFVMAGGGTASFVNCTLVDSGAGLSLPLLDAHNGAISVQNSILSSPAGAIVLDPVNGIAGTFDHNLYDAPSVGVAPGASSLPLGSTPAFVTPSTGRGTGDFRLLASSDAIDAANAAIAPADDIAGIARPQGGGVDIGAHEFDGVASVDTWQMMAY